MRKLGARLAVSVLFALLIAGTAHAVTYTVNVALDGNQENPPTGSVATGSGTLTIDTNVNSVAWNITHNVVSPTAAHIHGPAARDKNAGVLVGFPSPNSPMVGSGTYLEANEAALLRGEMYVNIHNGTNPGGDIRGQIPAAPAQAPSVSRYGLMALAAALLAIGGGFVARRRRALA